MGDLLDMDSLKKKLPAIIEWKNLTVAKGYGADPIRPEDMIAWLEEYGLPFKDYICNTTEFLTAADKAGKNIMFEAQLGALRDIDFGIVPYTSASSTIAAYAPVGAGIPGKDHAAVQQGGGLLSAAGVGKRGPRSRLVSGQGAAGQPAFQRVQIIAVPVHHQKQRPQHQSGGDRQRQRTQE